MRGHRENDVVFRECLIPDDWIGVDLNTTGHVAVVAHPVSGGIVMLGDISGYPDRDRANQNQRIAKEIVKMARQLWCGIKLEDLTGAGFTGRKKRGTPLAFSRREGSFYHLQKLIERRATGRRGQDRLRGSSVHVQVLQPVRQTRYP